MLKSFCCGLLLVFLLAPMSGFAGSFESSGTVDSKTGIEDPYLRYEGFHITADGFVTGYIVNTGPQSRPGLRLDMWTTNMAETKILWRKKLEIGDLAAHARHQVREPYKVDNEDPNRTKFWFRLPSEYNYRNKK